MTVKFTDTGDDLSISEPCRDDPATPSCVDLAHLRAVELAQAQRTASNSEHIRRVAGRIKMITAVLLHRHGPQCRTDDAVVYADLVLPHFVELANLDHKSDFERAVAWYQKFIPDFFSRHGRDGMWLHWAALSRERSVALSNKYANPEHRDKPYVWWLPTARAISEQLVLTHAERDAINARAALVDPRYGNERPIRGIPVVDPLSSEEKRVRDRLRKAAKRLKDGRTPQKDRTLTKQLQAWAEQCGVHLSTIKRKRKEGSLEAFLADRGVVNQMYPHDSNNNEADRYSSSDARREAADTGSKASLPGRLKQEPDR